MSESKERIITDEDRIELRQKTEEAGKEKILRKAIFPKEHEEGLQDEKTETAE